jgi:hypothetical protein
VWQTEDIAFTPHNTSIVHLFFRNSAAYNGIICLTLNNNIPAAEMLLRPLFEGTVIFSWCVIDSNKRAMRYCLTQFEGELHLINEGFQNVDKKYLDTLNQAINSLKNENTKHLPDFKQMLDELSYFKKPYSYNLYCELSKKIHATAADRDRYFTGQYNESLRNQKELSNTLKYNIQTWACSLQLQNIMALIEINKLFLFAEFEELIDLHDNLYAMLLHYDWE